MNKKITTHKVITVRLQHEHHAAFRDAAERRALTLTAWITQACLAYEMKEQRFARQKQAVQPPMCTTCGHRHLVGQPHGKMRADDPW